MEPQNVLAEFSVGGKICQVGHVVAIRGGFMSRGAAPRYMASKTINGTLFVQVSQYDHWLSHAVAGHSRSQEYVLRDMEVFDVLTREANDIATDDPMLRIMNMDNSGGKRQKRQIVPIAEAVRCLEVPLQHGQEETHDIFIAPVGRREKQVWLRLQDLPWLVRYLRAAIKDDVSDKSESEEKSEAGKDESAVAGANVEDEGEDEEQEEEEAFGEVEEARKAAMQEEPSEDDDEDVSSEQLQAQQEEADARRFAALAPRKKEKRKEKKHHKHKKHKH